MCVVCCLLFVVVCCLLFVVCCLLFVVVCCLLFVVCCWLCVVGCWLLVVVGCCVLVVCWLVVGCLLSIGGLAKANRHDIQYPPAHQTADTGATQTHHDLMCRSCVRFWVGCWKFVCLRIMGVGGWLVVGWLAGCWLFVVDWWAVEGQPP